MSLARTALRLAAIAALEADPVVGTICAGHIFDSRIDNLDAREPVPVIVVFTEDDRGHAWSVNNGGPPFDHACDLLIEISLRVVVPIADTDDVQIGCAETDAAAEATIDLLEEAAVLAVTNADTPQAKLTRDAVLRRATELKSIRYASADSASKLALRAVSLTAHLKIDQPLATDFLGDDRPTGPFAALPNPLRTVAASLSPTSAGYATCAALAARLTVPTQTSLEGVDVGIYPTDLKDPTAMAAWRNEGPWTIDTDPYAPDPLASSFDLPRDLP